MAGVAFHKRSFTLPSFARSIAGIFSHPGELFEALTGGRIDQTFSEKIMLAVTQVNDCRYCSYYHSRRALQAGVTPEEVQQLLKGELGGFEPDQAVALAFAQHWAEQEGRPDPQAWERLVEVYGPAAAADIRVYIRMITIGNLLGNTFDRFLFTVKRLKP